ncbi:MAG: electron transfer flavoprotein subunit alpha/FixB family protein [Actinomycetota bacterium]
MTMLVLLEHDCGEITEAAREALTAARILGDSLGESIDAVAIGAGADDVVDEAGRFGADTVHVVSHDLLTDYGPDAWAEALAQLADDADADVVMSVGTDRGNEVMAQMAARIDAPFVANCTEIDTDDDPWSVTRVQWGGSLLEDVTLTADRKLVTYAHHAVAAEPADAAGDATVETFEPDLDESVTVTMIADRDVLSQGITLSTSPVVVSGGRGVGSADAFAPLEELAELLGGVVGCSRAVTNNGWRPHSDQVGQTGTRIAPEIYIATGISGAIQHWVGAMASKRILAINTDPEANMVSKADYAVIADLHKVVPAISAEIRRRRGA